MVVRIGVIGTGGMAGAHAQEFAKIKAARLTACYDVDAARARAYADKFGIAKVYSRMEDLLADQDVDAVTNVTPDKVHCAVALAACKAGKHILSEKPLATSVEEGRKMVAAAKKAGVINMVNFSYRNSSALHAAADLVRKGALGRIMHVESSYLQSWLATNIWGDWRTSPALTWRLSSKHGSLGDLGDIGCHILDLTGCIVGDFAALNAELKTFPKGIKGERLGEYVLDANDSFVLTADFKNGAIGVVHSTRWATGHGNSLRCRVFGDKGAVEIDLDRSYTSYRACLGKDVHKAVWKEHQAKPTPNMYARFVRAVQTGKNDASDFENGLKIQACLAAAIESSKKGRAVKIKA